MLGLLQRSVCSGPDRNTAGHVTFILSVPDHESEKKRLENLGLRVNTIKHKPTGKRSLCFRDPEGNEVELLCQWQHQ
jgi:predicted enzyme related to lactoylglutathione lyase